jgi:hypothetical protein
MPISSIFSASWRSLIKSLGSTQSSGEDNSSTGAGFIIPVLETDDEPEEVSDFRFPQLTLQDSVDFPVSTYKPGILLEVSEIGEDAKIHLVLDKDFELLSLLGIGRSDIRSKLLTSLKGLTPNPENDSKAESLRIACHARKALKDQLHADGLPFFTYRLHSVVDISDEGLESSTNIPSTGVRLVRDGLKRFRDESNRLDLEGSEPSNDWIQDLTGFAMVKDDGTILGFKHDRGLGSYGGMSSGRTDTGRMFRLDNGRPGLPCRPVLQTTASPTSVSLPSGMQARRTKRETRLSRN